MMWETIVTRQVAYYFVGVAIAVGIAAKLLAVISLKRLVRASSNMSRSNHALMRLVRAKFEHACMVSDRVHNIGAFVDKYLYEYRVLGFRLHTLRRLEGMAVWLCLLFAAAGAGLSYFVQGLTRDVYQYLILGGAGALFLLLLRGLTDERYHLEAARMYMVDFLENTYARRYEKPRQKEFQVTVQKAAETPDLDRQPQEVPPLNDPTILPGNTPGVQPEPVPREDPLWQPESGERIMELEEEYELDEPPAHFWGERTRPKSTAPMPQAEHMNPEPRAQAVASANVQAVYDEYDRTAARWKTDEAETAEGQEYPGGTEEAAQDRLTAADGQGQRFGSAGMAAAQQMAADRDVPGGGREQAVQAPGKRAGSQEFPREERIREILEEFLVM